MKWRAISKLTEDEFDAARMRHRLIVWNSCNGPHMVSAVHDDYAGAWEIQFEGVWEKYLIIPEAIDQTERAFNPRPQETPPAHKLDRERSIR